MSTQHNTNARIDGKSIFILPSGKMRHGAKGEVFSQAEFFGQYDKGTARKIRKALYRQGYTLVAAVRRVSIAS